MSKRTVRCESERKGGGNQGKEVACWRYRQKDRQVEKLYGAGYHGSWHYACSEMPSPPLKLEPGISLSYNLTSQVSS